MNPDIVLIGAPALLLLALAIILWLVWANRRLHRIVADLERSSRAQYKTGKALGRAECEAKWRDEPLYQIGFETGKIGEFDRGYQAALVDRAGEACEMQMLRESGELTR